MSGRAGGERAGLRTMVTLPSGVESTGVTSWSWLILQSVVVGCGGSQRTRALCSELNLAHFAWPLRLRSTCDSLFSSIPLSTTLNPTRAMSYVRTEPAAELSHARAPPRADALTGHYHQPRSRGFYRPRGRPRSGRHGWLQGESWLPSVRSP
mgnify:FL=1